MGFVDCDHRDPGLLDKTEERFAFQPFGRDIDDPVFALCGQHKRFAVLARSQGAVQIGGPDPVLIKRAYLVFHERNKRRNDQRDAFEHERGDLVADAFACARRHDGDRIAPLHDRIDDLLLPRPERIVAELFF